MRDKASHADIPSSKINPLLAFNCKNTRKLGKLAHVKYNLRLSAVLMCKFYYCYYCYYAFSLFCRPVSIHRHWAVLQQTLDKNRNNLGLLK